VNDAPGISELRKLYKDILTGYTKDYDFGAYIKHFREIDIGYLNEIKGVHKSDAIKRGLQTEKEKIKSLIDQGVWGNEKEEQIQILKGQISNQYQTKRKLIIQSQVKQVSKRIGTLEKELSVFEDEKNNLLGLTAERYADKISSEQVIRLAFFSDEKLEKPKYTEEEYDYLEPEELNELVERYGIFVENFREKNIKRISACSFFMNNLFLAKNDPTRFYGKPIIELTNNQLEIFSIGLSYKGVLENGKTPPVNLNDNIDGLVDWYESADNLGKTGEQNSGKSGSTVMGATSKELDSMVGGGENVLDLAKEAQKKGGELDMEDFMNLHDPK
jgi:hypothetical protein